MKTTKVGTPDLKEVNARISRMLEEAIVGDEVIVLTSAGSKETFDLLNDEKAFFDVLTADPEVIASMEDDILIKIAKDLTKTVKENMYPAWHESKRRLR